MTRRDFLGLIGYAAWAANTIDPPCGAQHADLQAIGEIRRGADGVLRATITIEDELRSVWTAMPNTPADQQGNDTATCLSGEQMRYFAGSTPGGKRVWPVAKGLPGPGPTLRARVGDRVEITLLNHVDVKNFPNTLDLAEQGKSGGCDVSNTLAGEPGAHTRQEVYPDGDITPNCFHGSSTANLHFHGMHVSPDRIGDNVLVQVRPSPRDPKTNRPLVTEASVQAAFQEVFQGCSHGHGPRKWEDLPASYREMQQRLIKQYDEEIPIAKLGEANERARAAGLWPQFFVGAYPNSFRITEYNKPPEPGLPPARMGQSPGLHWYHAHKHGSTALNAMNGMAGAFVVEGEYDDQLRAFYGKEFDEKVLVLQQLGATLNLLKAPTPNGSRQFSQAPPHVFVNGQLEPVLEMRPGQVQLWRVLNACGSFGLRIDHIAEGPERGDAGFQWRQTAQDGVQFQWSNYSKKENRNAKLILSPANRADLLMQAPMKPGLYSLRMNTFPAAPVPVDNPYFELMKIRVKGEPMSMRFPEQEREFPKFPEFLGDIDPGGIRIRRQVSFHTESFGPNGEPGTGVGRGRYPKILPSKHTIDGTQFTNNTVAQVILQDTAEEWTLINTTPTRSRPDDKGVAHTVLAIYHPFHIHVNPFQVVEVFDPVTMDEPVRFEKNFIWHDTIAIPPAYNWYPDGKRKRVDKDGKQMMVPGYLKIRSRFDDFSGTFVLHCHILAHEDRGMMQLVQVVPGRTLLEHYH